MAGKRSKVKAEIRSMLTQKVLVIGFTTRSGRLSDYSNKSHQILIWTWCRICVKPWYLVDLVSVTSETEKVRCFVMTLFEQTRLRPTCVWLVQRDTRYEQSNYHQTLRECHKEPTYRLKKWKTRSNAFNKQPLAQLK